MPQARAKSQPTAPDLCWTAPRRPRANSAWTGLPFHSSNIRFPFGEFKRPDRLELILASKKMSKIPHAPQLLRVRVSIAPTSTPFSFSSVPKPIGNFLESLYLNLFLVLSVGHLVACCLVSTYLCSVLFSFILFL